MDFSFGKQASEDIAKANAEKLAREKAESEKKIAEDKAKFESIKEGSRIGYKKDSSTPVEFFTVKSKDENSMQVELAELREANGDPIYVSMDQIVDIHNN